MLRLWPEVCHVGSAANGRDGIALCREKQPAIVLLDLGLPDLDGFAVWEQLHTLPRPPRALLLTGRTDEALLHRVGLGGFAGLLCKDAVLPDHLRPALAVVAAERTYYPREVGEALRRFRGSPDAFFKLLSPWELKLVSLLAQGHRDDDIAAQTGCRGGTIRNHWHNIAGKLGLRDRHDLHRWAVAKGFGFGPGSSPHH